MKPTQATQRRRAVPYVYDGTERRSGRNLGKEVGTLSAVAVILFLPFLLSFTNTPPRNANPAQAPVYKDGADFVDREGTSKPPAAPGDDQKDGSSGGAKKRRKVLHSETAAPPAKPENARSIKNLDCDLPDLRARYLGEIIAPLGGQVRTSSDGRSESQPHYSAP